MLVIIVALDSKDWIDWIGWDGMEFEERRIALDIKGGLRVGFDSN